MSEYIGNMIKKYTPSWKGLESIGNNNIVKSSYMWIIVIPIIAKFFEKFPTDFSIPFYKNLTIILVLPFSWQLLYLSALIFAVSTLLFVFFCPEIINKFSNVKEYIEKGLGKEQLIIVFSTWLRKDTSINDANGNKIEKDELLSLFYKKYCKELKDTELEQFNDKSKSLDKRIRKLSIKKSEFYNAFWFVRSYMANDRIFYRFIITLLYSIGGLILFKLLA